MKKFILSALAVVAVLLMSAMPGQAERGGGGHGGGWGGGHDGGWGGGHGGGWGGEHGGGWGGGWGWGPSIGLGLDLGLSGYPYYCSPYYPYYSPAPVIEQPTAEIYAEPVPSQPSQPVQQTYWYYCRAPEGYYPYVKQCPGGWMKVVPSPPQQ